MLFYHHPPLGSRAIHGDRIDPFEIKSLTDKKISYQTWMVINGKPYQVHTLVPAEREEAKRRGLGVPVLEDRGAALADALGIEYSTHAVVAHQIFLPISGYSHELIASRRFPFSSGRAAIASIQ